MAHRTSLFKEQLKTVSTLMKLPVPDAVKRKIARIHRSTMIERISQRVFLVHLILYGLLHGNADRRVEIRSPDRRTIVTLTLTNDGFFRLQLDHHSNDQTFTLQSHLAIPRNNTQRLGNILYYILGAFHWDLDELRAVLYNSPFNSLDLVTSFLNETFFKMNLYKRIEAISRIPWIQSLHLVHPHPPPADLIRALEQPMDFRRILEQGEILWQ